jgi:hypothetical protein
MSVGFLSLVVLASYEGLDHQQYLRWSAAIVKCDIEMLKVDQQFKPDDNWVRAPTGVPFSHWSIGSGMLIAPAMFVLSPFGWQWQAGMVTGCLCSVVAWCALYKTFALLAGRTNAILGVAIAFLGTPLGYYSVSVSSETYSLLPAALIALQTITILLRSRASNGDALVAGSLAAMLLLIRSYLAAYAFPLLFLILFLTWKKSAVRGLVGMLLMGMPIVVSLGILLLTNYWMSGNCFHAPYQFGDDQFQSLDWSAPYLGNVLFDTFHGLLPVHPLVGVGFLSMIGVWLRAIKAKQWPEAIVWFCSLLAMAINVYFQGCWWYWWLSDISFGMRGLVVPGIPATLACLRALQLLRRSHRGLATALLYLLVVCSLWSWLQLLQGPMSPLTWNHLCTNQLAVARQWATEPEKLGLLLLSGVLILPLLPWRSPKEIALWVCSVGTTSFLLDRFLWFQPSLTATYAIIGVFALGATILYRFRFFPRAAHTKLVAGAFLLMVVSCLPLALSTSASIKRPIAKKQVFTEADFVRGYQTLAGIPRFEAHRNKFADFIGRYAGEERQKTISARQSDQPEVTWLYVSNRPRKRF